MDASMSDAPDGYRTIAGAAVSSDQVRPGIIRAEERIIPFFRRLSFVIGITALAAIASFIAGRYSIPQHSKAYPTAAEFQLAGPSYQPISWNARTILPSAHTFKAIQTQMPRSPLESYKKLPPFARSTVAASETVDDFTIDEKILSKQCSLYRSCRARLIITKIGDKVHVEAGYLIYAKNGGVVTVDRKTKNRIGRTTEAQAISWATELLAVAQARLDEIELSVTVEEIAAAIMAAQKSALQCPKTDDALCSPLVAVTEYSLPSTAAPAASETSDPCTEYIRSGAQVSGYEELMSKCPDNIFYYNRLGVSLPFCTTHCGSKPSVKHTVYMPFYVQTYGFGSKADDEMARDISPGYNMLYPEVPSCDDVPQVTGEGRVIVDVAASRNMPQELVDLGKANGHTIAFFYFMDNFDSVEDVISNSCAA